MVSLVSITQAHYRLQFQCPILYKNLTPWLCCSSWEAFVVENPSNIIKWMGNHNQPLMNNINPIRVVELQDNVTIRKRNHISTSDKLHGYYLIQAKTKQFNIGLYKVNCGGLTCDSLNAYGADKCPWYQITHCEAPICLIIFPLQDIQSSQFYQQIFY